MHPIHRHTHTPYTRIIHPHHTPTFINIHTHSKHHKPTLIDIQTCPFYPSTLTDTHIHHTSTITDIHTHHTLTLTDTYTIHPHL